MSERVTWLLSLAIGLAILDATFVHLDRRDAASRAPETGAIAAFDPAAVARVTLSRGGRTVVAARTAVAPQPNQPAWVIASARKYPGHAARIESALQRIKGWKRGRIAGDRANHEAFQVTPERALSIKLEDFSDQVLAELYLGGLTGLDPEKARLSGGNVDPKSVGRYVRVAGEDAVLVIDDFVISELEPDLQQWLEAPLLGGDGDVARVRGFSLRSEGRVIPIVLEGPYPRLEGADSRPVEPDVAWAIAGELARAFAMDVAAGDESKLGLSPAKLQADVVWNDGTLARLLVGDVGPTTSAGPTVHAKVEGRPAPVVVPRAAVATLASFTLDQLNLVHVVGRHVMDQATKVTFTENDRVVVVAKTRTGWDVAATGTKPRKVEGPLEEARQKAFAKLAALGYAGTLPAAPVEMPAFTVLIERPGHRVELRVSSEARQFTRSGLPWTLVGRPSELDELRDALRSLAGS